MRRRATPPRHRPMVAGPRAPRDFRFNFSEQIC
jgi:hypothetical protein